MSEFSSGTCRLTIPGSSRVMDRIRQGRRLLAVLALMPLPSFSQEYSVVLRVNERIATSYDYQERRFETARAINSSDRLSEEQKQELLANIGPRTMNELFEELLMLSRADQLGIRVVQADIDDQIAKTKANYGIESQEQFEQALASSGMTYEKMRENISKSFLVQKVMSQEVQPRISLEEEDLRRYYQSHSDEFQVPERLHLREIVLLESSGLEIDDLTRIAAEIRSLRQS